MFNADSFGITAPHTRIAVDALHYDKTEIKSEGIYTQFEKCTSEPPILPTALSSHTQILWSLPKTH
ncbi:MAG: hypothetical protein IPN94_02005 [Sphingobacteriales bacterium]|nr:hypothetical protein [Sphingobacteriales bacterium]